jgi:ribose 5-phosphate isomerase B
MKIVIGSDHAGYELKSKIKAHLQSETLTDVGCDSEDSVDYPTFAKKVAQAILNKEADLGILVCGTGIGMSIAANRHKGIRASLCHSVEAATATRLHNNSNILCVGSRTMDNDEVLKIVDAYLKENFEGGRHQKRVDLIEL